MAAIDSLILDAENRASQTAATATAYLAGSMQELYAIFGNPGIDGDSTVVDPQAPGPFTPAVPPQLTEVLLDTSGAPGTAPEPADMPEVMEGVDARPRFTAPPPVLLFPPRPTELKDFDKAPPPIRTDITPAEAPSMDPGPLPTVPQLNMPNAPGGMRSLQSTSPHINTDLTVPEPPRIDLGTAPVLRDVLIPATPQLNIPTFEVAAPQGPGDAPQNLAAELVRSYRETAPAFVSALEGQMDARMGRLNPEFHSQMALLESKLKSFIVDQGTALRPEVENAIYERSRDKVSAEFRRARSSAYSDAARRGLTLPDGAAFSAVRQARLAGADANARASVEIAVKQAELEQQNIQFAITTSSQLRTTILQASISYHQSLVSLNGQAIDMAQSVVNNIVEMFNAAVKVYLAKVDAYRAEASVYETHIRALGLRIDIFKAEISALQATVQVDAARVDAYKSSVDAMQAVSNIYRSQIEAVAARAGLEKLKIEAFGAEVDAYRAETQAKTAEWQGYAAAVNGQEAQAKIFSAQMDGFRATVESKRAQMEGYKVSEDVKIASLAAERLKIDGYTAEVQAYSARAQAKSAAWSGYSAGVSGESTKVQTFAAQANAFANEVNAWKTQIDGNSARISGVATSNKGKLDAFSAQSSAYGEKMRAEGARAAAAMQFQQQLIVAYDAANRAAIARSESESRHYQTQVQVAIERGRMDTTKLVENAKVRLSAAEGISRASTAGGQVLAGMANAAMSGINTLVSQAE